MGWFVLTLRGRDYAKDITAQKHDKLGDHVSKNVLTTLPESNCKQISQNHHEY